MTAETVSLMALILFVIGLVVVVASIVVRLLRFVHHDIPRPRLLWRDVMVFGGLALTFVAIGVHTALGRPFDDEMWWRAATGLVAVGSMTVMAYFELWVIGHRRDGPPEISEHNGTTSITTHGPSTITVEPDGTEEPR